MNPFCAPNRVYIHENLKVPLWTIFYLFKDDFCRLASCSRPGCRCTFPVYTTCSSTLAPSVQVRERSETVNKGQTLKGTVQRDFRPPVFFIIRTGLGHWPWVKIVLFSVPFLLRYSNFFESQSSMILYCAESGDFSVSYLKGESNENFYLFFHNLSLPWPLSSGLKYFRFL